MIINTDLVKRIKDHFGLNIYESKVWLALLSKGVVSAGETAELSGVPRSRTYDVLESLAKRGFAIVKLGKPVKYIAIEPKTVVEKMKNKTLQDAQEKVKTLSNLRETTEYTELEQLHKTGITPVKAEDLSGHLQGRANTISKMREVFANASKEVIICTSTDDFENKSRILIPALDSLAKDKVKVKLALSGEIDKIKRLSKKYDLKIKQIDNKGKFFIGDRKEILFMIHPENADEEIGVWINSPFFANTIAGMFNNLNA
jgi:HTH-type transcriptional regulator, sugar sensing transcriptional regulator